VHAKSTSSAGSSEGRRAAALLRPVGHRNDSFASVRDAVLIGLALGSLIMVLFLRDWGTSLVAGLVIPATLAVTFIVLRALGESFNLMTLALAACGGPRHRHAIVDRRERGDASRLGTGPAEAIRSAIAEIPRAARRIDHHADRRVSPARFDHRRDRHLFKALASRSAWALLTSLALALTWTRR